MRRVATFIVAFGLIIVGIGGSILSRPWAGGPPGVAGAPPGVAGARLDAWAGQDGTPVKAVRFGGYTIDVPAGWPVYRLDRDPTTCVRYDRNAVYLGHPGPDQLCPAHLVGRVATITLQVPPAAGRAAPGGPAASVPAAFPEVGNLPQVGGPVRADSPDHQLYAGVQHPGLSISATYGRDATPVLKIIQTVRKTSPPPGAPGQPAGTGTGQPDGTGVSQPARAVGGLKASPVRANIAAGRVVGKGFDACTAPSLAVMQAWNRAFSYAGIYIGGAEVGCAAGNLSAAWIRSVTALGWGLIPAYVGPQAPCSKQFAVRVNPSEAAAQGQAAALDAVQDAVALGLGRGTPIYYDMESFNSGNAACRSAVLSFLDAWTRQLHASRYVSGVYSSAATGARALGLATSIGGHSLAEPDALWFADWDGQSNVAGTPYLSPGWWVRYQRIKQYLGPHNRHVNGFTLNIDSDLIRGPVYR
jgi:hypothetical protein